jgi:putative membrane protein
MSSKRIAGYNESIGVGLVFLVSALSLHLFVTKDITLYIHPRYVIFTATMSVLGLAASLVYLFSHFLKKTTTKVGYLALFSILFMAVVVQLPPKDLSSSLAQNRSRNSTAAATVNQKIVLSRNTESLKLEDWNSLILQSVNTSSLLERKVKVSGFVLPYDDDFFSVARFVVTCCAVDAQPIYLHVYYPGWRNEFVADEWVEVSGLTSDFGSPIGVGVRPEKIMSVDRPKDPYAY